MDASQMTEIFQALLLQTEKRRRLEAEETENRHREEVEKSEKLQDQKRRQEAGDIKALIQECGEVLLCYS